jgi:putative peptidoglycan lipid II flippase
VSSEPSPIETSEARAHGRRARCTDLARQTAIERPRFPRISEKTTRLALGLVRASFVNGAGVLMLAAASLFRDTLILRTFGLGAWTDAFFLALLIPNVLASVLSSTFSSALIPAYHRAMAEGGDGGRAASALSALNLLVCGVCAGALLLAGPALAFAIGHNYPPDIRREVAILLDVLAALVVFAPMAATWAASLQAQQRFFTAACAPVLAPLLCALALLIGGKSIGLRGAGIALAAGVAVQAVLLAMAASRSGVPLPSPRMIVAVRKTIAAASGLIVALRQYPPLIVGSLLQSGLVIVPQLTAAWLNSGSVTVLSLGARMTTLGLAVIGAGIGVAVLPVLSSLAARRDWAGFTDRLRYYSVATLVVSIPAALGLLVLSEPIAWLLYGHGAATHAQIRQIAWVQGLYGLQMPAQILGIVWVRGLTAMNENRRLVQIAAVNLGLSVLCTIGLARVAGVTGVALAPTLVFAGACVQIFILLRISLAARHSLDNDVVGLPQPLANAEAA